jgi:hypothetical protein
MNFVNNFKKLPSTSAIKKKIGKNTHKPKHTWELKKKMSLKFEY